MQDIEKMGRENREERKEEQERERVSLQLQVLLLLASPQRFLFETRGHANGSQPDLNFRFQLH